MSRLVPRPRVGRRAPSGVCRPERDHRCFRPGEDVVQPLRPRLQRMQLLCIVCMAVVGFRRSRGTVDVVQHAGDDLHPHTALGHTSGNGSSKIVSSEMKPLFEIGT